MATHSSVLAWRIPRTGGAWCAAVYGVAQSWTRQKQFSSSSNAGDPDSVPGSGRSIGEGIGYTLQYSWNSLMTQLVKNLPAMWETWVRFLDWEDPLEKGTVTHSSILAWRSPWTV